MREISLNSSFLIVLMSPFFYCCNKNNDQNPGTGNTSVPAVFSKIYGATSITSDGNYVTIKCNGLPDHKSVYYPASNNLYENFNGTTFGGNQFQKNPNAISPQMLTFKIPVNPQVATTHQSTPLGPIGVSLNGVPFFNQYAGNNQPLTFEITSFDQYWGHPQQSGQYHYHVEPLYLTTVKASKSALLGFCWMAFLCMGRRKTIQQ